jgi:predicted PurR-regulated permease PerM
MREGAAVRWSRGDRAVDWIVVTGAVLWGLRQVRSAALVLLAGVLVAVVLAPVADWATRWSGGRRGVGALFAVGTLVSVVLVGTLSLGLPLVRETSRLLVALPEYLRLAAQELERLEAAWFPFLVSGEGGTVRVVASFAVGVLQQLVGRSVAVGAHAYVVIVVPFLAFYFMKDAAVLRASILRRLPDPWQEPARRAGTVAAWALRRYLGGLVVITLVGTALLWMGLVAVGMPNPLGWSVLVGLAESVPYLGPAFGVLTLGSVALMRGVGTAVAVVSILLGIRAVIDLILAPLVLRNLLRLHPVVILGAILMGADLLGLAGVFLAAPLATTIAMMLRASEPPDGGFPAGQGGLSSP